VYLNKSSRFPWNKSKFFNTTIITIVQTFYFSIWSASYSINSSWWLSHWSNRTSKTDFISASCLECQLESSNGWRNQINLQEWWQLIDLPPSQQAITTKWVYRMKYDANGTLVKLKVQLIAKRFQQQQGQDFEKLTPQWLSTIVSIPFLPFHVTKTSPFLFRCSNNFF
jgi:hypothetical protein